MKFIMPLLLLSFCLLAQPALSQKFEVPKGYSLASDEDYSRYKKDILAGIDWLEKAPVEEVVKRKDITGFLVEWMTGTPDVTIKLSADVFPMSEGNPERLMYFMAGWVKYALAHPGDTSEVKGNTAGLQCLTSMFKRNKSLKRDPQIKKLIALEEKGELEKWVQERLK